MLDGLRLGAALRAVARAVAGRSMPAPLPPLAARRLLVVLPAHAGRDVWAFLSRVALPPGQVKLIALGATSPPDRFAGAVDVVADDARDWRRLPSRAVLSAAHGFRPDVAINLAAPDDPAARLLVGASPAAVRIGRHETASESSYDLLVPEASDAGGPDVARLARLLARLTPPLLPLEPS